MKKKIAIIYLLFSIMLYCGCEINNLNSTKNPTKLTTSDIKQLVGITYGDVEKIYGTPESSTYYIKIDDLSSTNINYISLRALSYNSIIKACYNINNNDSYIVLWYKNNKVIKSYFNETDITNEDYLDMDINNVDIKIDYNNNASDFKKNLIVDKSRNYIGNNIKEFNNKYNLLYPKLAVNLYHKNKTLYLYDIKDNDYGYVNSNSLFIICDNNIITDISIIKSSKVFEVIISYIK